MGSSLKMEIRKLAEPHALEVIMEGEIDNPNILSPLEDAVAKFTGSGVMLNMKDVTYLNSSGFGEIMSIASACADRGLPVFVCCASERIHSVFESVAPGYFKTFDSPREALEFIK